LRQVDHPQRGIGRERDALRQEIGVNLKRINITEQVRGDGGHAFVTHAFTSGLAVEAERAAECQQGKADMAQQFRLAPDLSQGDLKPFLVLATFAGGVDRA
jgi:hypothetical protein